MKRAVLGAALAVILSFGLWLGLTLTERGPAGPVDPVWDFEVCAYCGMHVGERPYAAQFHPESGEPVFFDDPGCLLLWRDETGLEGDAYFRHAEAERWLAEREAIFVAAERTPMGWGFAVSAGATGHSSSEVLELLRLRRDSMESSR